MKSIEKTLEGLGYILRDLEIEEEIDALIKTEIQTLKSAIYHIEHLNTFVDGENKVIVTMTNDMYLIFLSGENQ